MHPKSPVSITQIPNAVGIDGVIQKITDLLGDVVWIEHVYGRAWSQVTGLGDKPRTLPFAYTGEGEYFGVLENDFVVSQAFIKSKALKSIPRAMLGVAMLVRRQIGHCP
ncbi:hypothetical protein DR864_00060 [Runella rosea]|uniref:Uncharacterized protein n=1 Tax=Runella rosea TaxID=2259595 RepID=A0A344TC54_9BACT|nr:hypothetical protein [Runella rosea]AXE16225.1 hypothetical protein DR864_00060 [Runella rosea]